MAGGLGPLVDPLVDGLVEIDGPLAPSTVAPPGLSGTRPPDCPNNPDSLSCAPVSDERGGDGGVCDGRQRVGARQRRACRRPNSGGAAAAIGHH